MNLAKYTAISNGRSETPFLVSEAAQLLRKMYSANLGFFSCRSTLVQGAIKNNFGNHKTVRYTINSLLGLQAAAKAHSIDWDVSALIEEFCKQHWGSVVNSGDHGLFLDLLSQSDRARSQFNRVISLLEIRRNLHSLTIQEAAWILSGLCRYAECGGPVEPAKKMFEFIQNTLVHPRSRWPLHSSNRLRAPFVSFGGIAYYLKCLSDYYRVTGEQSVFEQFSLVASRVIDQQQEDGAWPWFYDATTTKVLDRYQVYSVHQDAMAMLFLLPAVDMGMQRARGSINLSFDWMLGGNELSTQMICLEPFFIYRSIRRRESAERLRRYFRGLYQARRESELFVSPHRLEVNHECRSYHLGWLLFVWAGRSDFQNIVQLSALRQRAGQSAAVAFGV